MYETMLLNLDRNCTWSSYVAFAGRRIASAKMNVDRCELSERGMRKVVSPKEEPIVLHHWPQLSEHEKRKKLEPARVGN